jgi:hypothetical protein
MSVLDILGTAQPVGAVLLLVLLFGLKHLLADFILQTPWMVRGKGAAAGWMAPLLAHAGVHGALTTAIALVVVPGWWWLGLVDLLVHATLDRLKAAPRCGGRWCADQRAFWWAFGIDQEAHALTHLAFVAVLASSL